MHTTVEDAPRRRAQQVAIGEGLPLDPLEVDELALRVTAMEAQLRLISSPDSEALLSA